MNELGDELLDELQDLESSTSELKEQIEMAEEANQTAQHHSTQAVFQTAVFMLEAGKLAQETAVQNQEASQINLKLAQSQQFQIEDLQQANSSWRKAVEKASEELKTSKGFYIAIFVISLLTSLGVFAILSWFLYANNNSQLDTQQEIIDIIQTEAQINNRQLHAKLDEIQNRLGITDAANNLTPSNKVDNLTENLLVIENTENLTTELANNQATKAEEKVEQKQEVSQQDLTQLAELLEDTLAKQAKAIESALQQANRQDPATASNKEIQQKLVTLEKLINQQTASLQAISKQLNQQATTRSGSAATSATNPAKPVAQANQPTDDKLEAIQADIKQLQEQQATTQQEVQELGSKIEASEQKRAEADQQPKPYSYRNPYEYKE